MGEFHPTMLAALQGSNPEVYVLVTITGDSTYRWTHAKHGAVSSLAGGLYEGRMIRAGKVAHLLPRAEGTLKPTQVSFTVDDNDLVVAKALWDINYRRAVTIKLAAAGVASANYFPVFNGVVEGVHQTTDGYEIQCRYDDDWLQRKFPFGLFRAVDHANLQAGIESVSVPIVFGWVTSQHNGTGVYPGYCIDTTSRRFVVAGHRVQRPGGAAPSVGDGTSKVYISNRDNGWTDASAGAGNWTYGETVIAGQTYAYVDLDAAAPAGWVGVYPGDEPDLMFSLYGGLHDYGAIWQGAGGTMDQTPGAAWEALLGYFGWRQWRQGKYDEAGPEGTPPIGSVSGDYGAAWASNYPRCAGWLGGRDRRTVGQLLREFSDNWGFSPYLQWDGTLVALWWDHLGQTRYPTPQIDWDAPGVRGLRLDHQSVQTMSHILAQCRPRVLSNGNVEWNEIQPVSDAQSPAVATTKLDLRWFAELTTGSGQTNFMVRNLMSQRINRHRRRMPDLLCTLPLWYLDYTLGQDFGVAWDRGPNRDGTAGWSKEDVWSRHMYRWTEINLNLDTLELDCRFEDSQSAQATLWATYFSLTAGTDADVEAGICELGVITEADRDVSNPADQVWVDDSAASVCHRLGATSLPLDVAPLRMYEDAIDQQGGLMVQRAQTQRMLGSCFDSVNWGSWTAFGAATYARVVEPGFYGTVDATLNGYVTVTGPNPIAAATGIFQTSAALTLSYAAVAITYRRISGSVPLWNLTRSGGGNNTWDDTTKTWGVGKTNTLPDSSVGSIQRFRSNGIPLAGAGVTYALTIYFPNGSTALSSMALYEGAFVTDVPWAGSRIVAKAAAQARGAQWVRYLANNSSDHQVWPIIGSLEIEVMPQWNSSDLAASSIHTILDLRYDANNRWEVYHINNAGTSEWRFLVRAEGASVIATVVKAATRGRSYKIRVLFSGSQQELGLAEHTYQLSVEGEGSKSSGSVVGAAYPVYVASQHLYVGSDFTLGNQWDGWLRYLRIRPYVEAV